MYLYVGKALRGQVCGQAGLNLLHSTLIYLYDVKGGVGKFVGKLEKLAGLFSAIIHDFEHRGFNNDFLIKTVDEWAIDSNDKSPNETHHLRYGLIH